MLLLPITVPPSTDSVRMTIVILMVLPDYYLSAAAAVDVVAAAVAAVAAVVATAAVAAVIAVVAETLIVATAVGVVAVDYDHDYDYDLIIHLMWLEYYAYHN